MATDLEPTVSKAVRKNMELKLELYISQLCNASKVFYLLGLSEWPNNMRRATFLGSCEDEIADVTALVFGTEYVHTAW